MLTTLRPKFIGRLAHCEEHIYDKQPFTRRRLDCNEVLSLGSVMYQSRAALANSEAPNA